MTIQVGQNIPSVLLKKLTDQGMQDIATDEVFANAKVVLFGVPGAFTPTCSAKHLPGYVQNLAQFQAQGVKVVCMSVNDPFVMKAWASANNADAIEMLADGNATFTKALGLEMDGSGYGLGTRCQRFALYAENGKVLALNIENPGKFETSSAEVMLQAVSSAKAAA